ncbi:MAG: hypothetical protein MRY49_01780 [Candidatus Pacebacteria bacterium]|nr:hypothetical protein [Candidatus Paceibacterota bacterium]
MSNKDQIQADPFADLDLDFFKSEKKPSKAVTKKPKVLKEKVKAVAEEASFNSREHNPEAPKEKVIPKSFSLFREEHEIINSVIKAYLNESDSVTSQISGSDVIRAALYLFEKKSVDEQLKLVKQHRGRGRK